jgi:hypothetical protein
MAIGTEKLSAFFSAIRCFRLIPLKLVFNAVFRLR